MTNEIKCPKCGSTQLSANKKGFSGKKAVIGGVLTGGIGLLAGTLGSNNVIITCLACGKQFKPGEDKDTLQNRQTVGPTWSDRKKEEMRKYNEEKALKQERSEASGESHSSHTIWWILLMLAAIMIAILIISNA